MSSEDMAGVNIIIREKSSANHGGLFYANNDPLDTISIRCLYCRPPY